MLRRYKNTAPPVLLQAEVSAGDTALDVGDTSTFPDKFPFIVAIERGTVAEEACLVTSKTATDLIVDRGVDGTTAQYHPGLDSSGFTASLVEHTTAAIDYREAQVPWITEAQRDALDEGDSEDMWDGRMIYNGDRRSVEIAHYDEVGSDESLGENFIEWAGIVPTGTILPFSASVIPTGFLLCNGAAHLRADHPGLNALYAADGYPFGNGDGSTTFNVPDLRQRFPLGKAASGTGSTLGETGGAIDHIHTQPTHTHSGPSHTHTNPSSGTAGDHIHSLGNTGSAGGHAHNVGATGTTGGHTHGFSGATTSSDNHSHSGNVSNTTTGPSATAATINGTGNTTIVASQNHTHVSSDGFTTNSDNHAHTVSVAATSTDGNHSHNVGATNNTGNHTHTTPNTNTTGDHTHTQGSTGSAGTGATGSGGGDETGTANAPFLALNFMVKT